MTTLQSCKKEGNFRAVAEFEPQSSVLIGWNTEPFATQDQTLSNDSVSVKIIKSLQGQGKIIIQCYDEAVKKRAENALKLAGVKTNEIDFWIYPSQLMYPRDYAADILRNDKGEKKLAKFDFNLYASYPSDYKIEPGYLNFAVAHAERLGITNKIVSPIVSEGGDREFNGDGVMMAIEETEVKKRNPKYAKEHVEAEFKKMFGIQKIIWIPRATYDDENMYSGKIPDENNEFTAYRSASANGHIDEMARFIDKNTILVAHVTEEEAQKSLLAKLNKERTDEALQVLEKATDIHGKPFKIVKMPMPEPFYIHLKKGDSAFGDPFSVSEVYKGKMLDGSPFPKDGMKALSAMSYCNFLIFNDVVLCQEYWREGLPEAVKKRDKEALEILKNLFPNRKVIPINSYALNLYGGGIHCNTKNVTK